MLKTLWRDCPTIRAVERRRAQRAEIGVGPSGTQRRRIVFFLRIERKEKPIARARNRLRTVDGRTPEINVALTDDRQAIRDARIAYGVAGPVPMRAPSAEAAAKGSPVNTATADAFARAVLQDIHPRDSWRAAKDFREHIAVEMARRALIESIRLAGGVIDG